MPLLSVLTVAKNSKYTLLNTFAGLAPLLSELHRDIEWIIIDGCSTDETCNCLQAISSCGFTNIRIYIERDSGIYNAMNKAFALSNSKYVIFLNSGDVLQEFAAKEFVHMTPKHNSIYVYSYLIRECNLSKILAPSFLRIYLQAFLSLLYINLPTSHNSIVYPASLIKQFPFKEKYLCAADFEQYVAAKSNGFSVVYRLSQPLSIIDATGYISTRILSSYREYLSISRNYSNSLASLYWYFRLVIGKLV